MSEIAERITLPDAPARDRAAERQARLTKPAGSLGRLEELSVWLCGVQGACPPRVPERVRVVIIAGDHGVARTAGTSAYPPEVTAQMVLNFLAGGAAVNAIAGQVGATVRVLDVAVDVPESFYDSLGPDARADLLRHRVRRGSGSLDREDALTRQECEAALAAGVSVAEEEADAGADLLIVGDMGIGNTTPAAVLVGLLAGREAADVVGRGTGVDDAGWMRKCGAVRDGMRRGRPLRGDLVGLLAAVGGADLAATTGLLLGAAARGVPVLLDGVVSCACALVAQRMAFRAPEWWRASHLSTEPAAAAALEHLGLEPLLDLDLRLGEGTGALLAVPLVRAAAATLAEMATFDEAGVTDR